jgi:hypothetical protein
MIYGGVSNGCLFKKGGKHMKKVSKDLPLLRYTMNFINV